MIKLKNLWKVALSTVAMASMLVACDTSSTEEEVTPGTYTAGTGVYELKAPKSKIGSTFNTWGGFGVLLLKEDQLSAKVDPQAVGTFAVPTAQLTCGSNLKFPKYATAKGNAKVTSGEKVLNGAWATLTENDFTFYVDMSQIVVDGTAEEVKAFGDGNELMGNAWLKTGRNLDLTGYKPYIIALFDGTSDIVDTDNNGNVTATYAKYAGECSWSTGIWEMKPSTATKPTSFGSFLNEGEVSAIDLTTTKQAGAKFRIEGAAFADANGKDMTFTNGVATLEFSVTEGEANTWNMAHFACWFKFYAGDDTTLAQTSKQYYAGKTKLGKAINITDDSAGGNLEVEDLTSAGAGTYEITVDATGDIPTIKVEKKA